MLWMGTPPSGLPFGNWREREVRNHRPSIYEANTYRRYPSQIVKPVVVAPAGIDCHIVNPTGWTLSSGPVSFREKKS